MPDPDAQIETIRVILPEPNIVYISVGNTTHNVTEWGAITGTLNDQTDLQAALDLKEDEVNKSTDTSLGASNILYPSQNAVKTYVDNAVVGLGLVDSVFGRTGDVVAVSGDYSEDKISFTDITTNNVSALKHGYVPKLPDDTTLFFNGAGEYVAIPASGGGSTSQLISGGGVAWTGTNFDYIISAAIYIINGVQYSSAQTPVTLAPAHATLNRIDVFYVDTGGLAGVITGTPATNPVAPSVDPATQLYLTFAAVDANTTEPTVTTVNIYLENTEYTMSTNSAGTINLASTNNPYAGTKDIEGTATATGNFFTGVKPSGTLDLSPYQSLIFQIRSKATWPNPKSLSIFWMNGATVVGTSVALHNGVFGFDSSNILTYQQIVVPIALFNTGTTVIDRIRVSVAGGGGNIGWYIDNIILQSGSGGGGGGGSGDFSTNTNVSIAGEIVEFADTTGKLGRRSSATAVVAKVTAGVLGTATPGTDYLAPSAIGTTVQAWDADLDDLALRWLKASAVGSAHLDFSEQTTNGTNAVRVLAPTSLASDVFATLPSVTGTLLVDTNGAALTKTDDTNVTLTLGGTPTTALIAAASLTLGWSGTLGISRGGFGKAMTDPNANRLIIWDDTDGDFQYVTVGTNLSYDHATHTLSATGGSATHAVTLATDGSGSVLSTGTKNPIKIPYGGTLTGWLLAGTPSGSVTVDIFRSADGAGLPVTSIVGAGTKPSLSSATEAKSTTFTSWTSTTLTAFDNLAISLSGITSSTYVSLTLYFS